MAYKNQHEAQLRWSTLLRGGVILLVFMPAQAGAACLPFERNFCHGNVAGTTTKTDQEKHNDIAGCCLLRSHVGNPWANPWANPGQTPGKPPRFWGKPLP